MNNYTILIVEDENIVALHIKTILQHLHHKILGPVKSGEAAVELAEKQKPDLILMDIKLSGDLDGIEAASIINKTSNIPVVYLTAFNDETTLRRASISDPFGFIVKPFDEKELKNTIEMAMYKFQFQKKAEEAVRISEQKYKNIFEFAPTGIYTSNYEGRILTANLAFAKLLGCSSIKEALTINLRDVYADKEERNNLIRQYENSGSTADIEVRWKKKDGEAIWVQLSVHTIKDPNGQTVLFEGFVRDITNRKLQEEQLIIAKEEAERSDRLKSEFLDQMSHEIRTPLNNILTYTSILKEEFEDKLPRGMELAFSVINSSSQRLIRTIELILNLSRIQTGNFETNFQVFDLDKDLLEDLTFEFYSRAKIKNLSFVYENHAKNTLIKGDQYSLGQVFVNLIDNAIKYTNTGGIQVELNEINNKISVSVSDTGIGISPEYLPNIFDAFSQEDFGRNRNFEGTGLGLALVKKYIEINNADISVVSRKWKGSTFNVTFNKSSIS